MMEIIIRPATLDDAAVITAIHCSTVKEWRDPVSHQKTMYTALDLYGRWRNGGPWMSVELCAVHLNALLQRGHLPLVATAAGQVVGEAEYYLAHEASPFTALHLSVLYVNAAQQGKGIGKALLAAGVDYARAQALPALTTQPDAEAVGFYTRLGFAPWHMGIEMQLSASGRPPAQLQPLTAADTPPESLALRIGRYQCGEQGWEALWPSYVLPGWSDLKRWAWGGVLADAPVILGLREQLTDPRQADGYAWLSPEAELSLAIEALRGLAAAQGFSAVDLLLPQAQLPTLKTRFQLGYQTSIALWRRPG